MKLRFSEADYFPYNGDAPSQPGLALDDIGLFPLSHLADHAGSVGQLLGKALRARFVAPPHFALRKIQGGDRHALIFVNGFLSSGKLDTSDWEQTAQGQFGHASWYHLDWSACSPADILPAESFLQPNAGIVLQPLVSWYRSMSNAEAAGKLLAKAIVSTPGWRFTLAGHSLGARVIHFALRELSRQRRQCVENAYLLGGAVDGGVKDDHCWRLATAPVKGHIFNCYSRRDAVLEWAYRGANARFSEPVGLSGINLKHVRIVDIDCTGLVSGHMAWKGQFQEILRRIDTSLGKQKNPLL
ncbi:DUF726 domain-containing protein [Pseudoduganella sp.]|uniref:DUF726 domain-containing protein n=1 Tax=Pseudoduganella sp. TaxID=1880898 RepID=UPI0035B01F31